MRIFEPQRINAIESSIKVKGKLSTNNNIAPFWNTKQNHNTVSQPYYNIISLKINGGKQEEKENNLRVIWPFERYNMKSKGIENEGNNIQYLTISN